MILAGENLFALRLVNIIFGLLAIAVTYLWARWAFDRKTALIGAALMAVSFWPVATSRQALRAGMLPFLVTVAVLFFWWILNLARESGANRKNGAAANKGVGQDKFPWPAVIGFAVFVAATLHTYLAARVLWLLFPAFLLYLAAVHRAKFRSVVWPTVTGLLLAGLLVIPMFAYVQAHPEAETRLQMLDRSLQDLTGGNFGPVLDNIYQALLAFFWPGSGDHFLAYNIPGRPVFGLATAFFFLVGIGVCLWCWRRPAYAFLLIWFGVGIIPALVTGPEANTTRNLGALPAAYLIPAVGFMAIARLAIAEWGRPARQVATTALLIWLFVVAGRNMSDYFVRWADSPNVRAAYQHTLTEALTYLEEKPGADPVIISTVYPGAAHDPSITKVLVDDQGVNFRWVDARFALVLPDGNSSRLVLPSSTPLHPAFYDLVRPLDSVALRPDDLDPYFDLYDLRDDNRKQADRPVNFGDSLILLDAYWLAEDVAPGETAQLVTRWRVTDPAGVGPLVPPAFETDVVLFTHVLDGSGNILTQRDSLEAPSWAWQAGDIVIQIHPVTVPQETLPGNYETVVGVYDRTSGERLAVLDGGSIADTQAFVVPLRVDER